MTCTAEGSAPNSQVGTEVLGHVIVCEPGTSEPSDETAPYSFAFTREANGSGMVTAEFESPEGAAGETTVRFEGQDPDGEPHAVRETFTVEAIGCSPRGDIGGGPLPPTSLGSLAHVRDVTTRREAEIKWLAAALLFVSGGALLAVVRRNVVDG